VAQERKIVLVTPTKQTRWQVLLDGGTLIHEAASKDEALQRAIDWASAHPPCVVRLFDANGKLESLWPVD
jgi:hypothetical protein